MGKQVQIYIANPPPDILGGYPGKGSQNQWWFFQTKGSYGYIYNAARQDLVLDVRGITGPVPDSNLVSVRGTPVQLYPVNKPATLNQLYPSIAATIRSSYSWKNRQRAQP